MSSADFRRHCDMVVSVGDCATMGGVPALRNTVPLMECLREAYLDGPSVTTRGARSRTTRRSRCSSTRSIPCHEVVKIDYHLPGCPPSADTLWEALSALLSSKPIELPYQLIKYD
jgi:NAD-reducing hydrogenase small subunit